MIAHEEYHRRGSLPYHGHCIHNDRPPRTRNFTTKGMFAAVIWIALWSLVIMAFVGHEVRGRQRVAAYYEGRHVWHGVRRAGEAVGSMECAKCGLDTRNRGVQMNDGPCPETRARSN